MTTSLILYQIVTNFDGLRSGLFLLGGGLHLFDCSDFLADGFPKCGQTFP